MNVLDIFVRTYLAFIDWVQVFWHLCQLLQQRDLFLFISVLDLFNFATTSVEPLVSQRDLLFWSGCFCDLDVRGQLSWGSSHKSASYSFLPLEWWLHCICCRYSHRLLSHFECRNHRLLSSPPGILWAARCCRGVFWWWDGNFLLKRIWIMMKYTPSRWSCTW